jgi:hypothetical protein
MLFEFEWFKRNIMKSHNIIGEDKELEAILVRDQIFVDYFEHIHVYDEKTRNANDFNNQRGRWIYTQLHVLINNLKYLPHALLTRNHSHIDKLLQWMLVPRTIMMSIIMLMSIILPFIYMTSVIKWWIAAAVVLFAFSLATPDYLVDKNWNTDFLYAPLVTIWGLINIFRVGKSEANTRLTAVGHNIKKITTVVRYRR